MNRFITFLTEFFNAPSHVNLPFFTLVLFILILAHFAIIAKFNKH